MALCEFTVSCCFAVVVETKKAITSVSLEYTFFDTTVESNSEPGIIIHASGGGLMLLYLWLSQAAATLSRSLECPLEHGLWSLFPLLKGHLSSHLQEAFPNEAKEED